MTLRHSDKNEWDVQWSTRQSLLPYSRYVPFSKALSTTAEDLIDIRSGGPGETATNLVTNPRLASSVVTMYTAVGSAIEQSDEQEALGSYSLKVNPENDVANAEEGFYWTSPSLPYQLTPQFLTAQCVVYGADDDVKIEIRNADGTSVLATSADTDLAANWNTRLTVSYSVAGSTAAAAYRVYVITASQHNTNFYVDKIMVEVREDVVGVSTYVDGDLGRDYQWEGVANASASLKRPDIAYVKGLQLKNDDGSISVYVAFDALASSTSGIEVKAGETLDTNWPTVFKRVSVVAASGTPSVHGVIWGVNQ